MEIIIDVTCDVELIASAIVVDKKEFSKTKSVIKATPYRSCGKIFVQDK